MINHRCHPVYLKSHRVSQRGFTLVELMVTIAVMAIIASIAVPSFRNQLAAQRSNNTSSTISEALRVGATEANLRRQPVTFTIIPATQTITLVDENANIINSYDYGVTSTVTLAAVAPSTTIPNSFVLTPNKQAVTIDPNTAVATPVNLTFSICDNRVSGEPQIQVTINSLVRVLVRQNGTCT